MEVVAFLRDLMIVIFGIVWIIAGILCAVLAWLAIKFVKSLPRRTEVVTSTAQDLLGHTKQAVGTAGEGARTAREAVTFVSEKAVVPTIAVVSAAAGVKGFVQILFNGPSRQEPSNDGVTRERGGDA